MDAKDPPPPPTATESTPSGEDGRIPETVGLAKEAAFLFQSRRFADSLDALTRLLTTKPDDPKVLHNIVVAEYFRDGCSDPRKLLDELNKIKVRTAELARASGEQKEVAGSTGNNAVAGSKVNSTMLQQLSSLNSGRTFYPDEFDTSVAVLNYAIVLFHLREYAHALSVLEPLYQNIQPIDETTAIRVCLLLLDAALSCRNASKAADVISYLERYFGVGQTTTNQGDSANTASSLPNQVLKVSGTSHASAPDASGPDSSGNANVPDNTLTNTLPDESFEYETLYSTLDSGHNLARPPSNDSSKLSSDLLAYGDLKLNLHLHKVRLLLLLRNLKAAKREIKLAMNVARSGDSTTALLLKSQLEFARGNHRKAFKLLSMSSSRTEPEMLSIFNNNMGCIYHQLGKHHTAIVFFSKALESGRQLWSEKPLKLASFSLDKSLVVLYNCGLQHLLCGKPLIAARCFDRARSVYYDRPILWLRFAECCLSALEKGLLKGAGATPLHNEDIRVHVVGSGRWRRLVVDDINSRRRYFDCIEKDGLITADGPHHLSLPFARRCLLTALQLMDNNTSGIPLSQKEEDDSKQITVTEAANTTLTSVLGSMNGDSKENRGNNLNTAFQSSLSTYEEICKKEKLMIKQAVLADLAYIELSLGNPGKALSFAKALQELQDCSRIYLFLSRVYAAEALCCLNRIEEAVEHLSVYFPENEVQMPYNEEDMVNWKIDTVADGDESVGPLNSKTSAPESQDTKFCKPAEARGILYVNLATMSALQGNLEQASRLVKEALSVLPNSPRATLAAIYVDLLSGRTQDALVKLKQCRHVKFFSPSVSSSST